MFESFPTRKSVRLKEYDYSQNGCYFVTICTEDKKPVFGRYDVGAIHESPAGLPVNRFILLNRFGKIAENTILKLPERYEQISVDNYIVMPNHIHLLISIDNGFNAERAIRESPLQRSLVSKAVGYLKMNISKEIHKTSPDLNIWQRGFYDHIIRGEDDFQKTWKYIEFNALKEYA